MHALLHRRARWNRNCGAHTRPPINYLKDQSVGSDLFASSTELLEWEYNNIWGFIDLETKNYNLVWKREPEHLEEPEEEFIQITVEVTWTEVLLPLLRATLFSFLGAVSAFGCNHCFISLEWQIWSHLSELKLSSPNPNSIHLCAQTTARLDPEVPPRTDPASNVMGKTIRYQVTEDHRKAPEPAKQFQRLFTFWCCYGLNLEPTCVFSAGLPS